MESWAAPIRAGAIPLPVGDTPGKPDTGPEIWFGKEETGISVRNVSIPTLKPVLPASGKATGAAVLVIPGGANLVLSMGNEGMSVARWFAEQGIAAFVLKYRTMPTPADESAFGVVVQRQIATYVAANGRGRLPGEELSLADAQAAMRLLRSRAREWNIDPNRIAALGFSAGAIAARNLALSQPRELRPALVGLIYGQLTVQDVPQDAPPLFAALAGDDPLFGRQGFALIERWQAARIPVELHFYEKGNHGFGMKRQGTTSDLWAEQFLSWIRSRGLLQQAD